MSPDDYLKAGKLAECQQALQQLVRSNAADPRLRIFLFQLFCVIGEWSRALGQLDVLASFNSETTMLARIFQPVLQCEMLRQKVFSGEHTPIIFGEPAEWMGLLIQANELTARGQFAAGQELRDRAFELAPATSGTVDGNAFEWIADADLRLGPVLEVIIEGHYYWVPFCRIRRMVIEKPTDLRDLVWVTAQFMWTNGGEASGLIPVRYSGTEKATDDQLRLSRKTDWAEREDLSIGSGQRILATNAGEYPLLESRIFDFATAA